MEANITRITTRFATILCFSKGDSCHVIKVFSIQLLSLPLRDSSSSVGAGNRRNDLGDLVAGTENALASGVLDVSHVLVLELSTLPDLNLAATTEDANSHSRKKVVSGVGVVVDTTVEDSGSILANG